MISWTDHSHSINHNIQTCKVSHVWRESDALGSISRSHAESTTASNLTHSPTVSRFSAASITLLFYITLEIFTSADKSNPKLPSLDSFHGLLVPEKCVGITALSCNAKCNAYSARSHHTGTPELMELGKETGKELEEKGGEGEEKERRELGNGRESYIRIAVLEYI